MNWPFKPLEEHCEIFATGGETEFRRWSATPERAVASGRLTESGRGGVSIAKRGVDRAMPRSMAHDSARGDSSRVLLDPNTAASATAHEGPGFREMQQLLRERGRSMNGWFLGFRYRNDGGSEAVTQGGDRAVRQRGENKSEKSTCEPEATLHERSGTLIQNSGPTSRASAG